MDDREDIESLSEVFQALSDPNRLRILTLLREAQHPMCVNAISSHIGVTQSAISQHLKILRRQKLVNVKKEGYFKHYSVDLEKLESIRALREKVLGADFRI